jgi:outer membrane protein OmpA-like peptidoglycan-associated protein
LHRQEKQNGTLRASKISVMKVIAIIFSVLTAASASAQPLHQAAYVPPIEAQVVHEPLQPRSVAYQRMCRAQLVAKLNRILETRDTPHGVVITVPDSMLLNGNVVPPETAEKLAKIAELFPHDVKIRVQGYTDHRGSEAENEANSYRRAQAVQDVLMANDPLPRSIGVAGFVSSVPLPGRANRRVEIVIFGQGIGEAVSSSRKI